MAAGKRDSVFQRLEMLYLDPKWYDLKFHCTDDDTGDRREFRVHRVILASCSPVFEALCYGPLAEKDAVEIVDVGAATFAAMLKFIYTDTFEAPFTEKVAFELLYVAKKYALESLENLTRDYLMCFIVDQNCINLHNFGIILDEPKLIEKTFHHICRRMLHVKKYFTTENLTKDLLLKLVTSPAINCQEATLAELAATYAKSFCQLDGLDESIENVTKCLGDIADNIRWELLKPHELPSIFSELKQHQQNGTGIERKTLAQKLVVLHRFFEQPYKYVDNAAANCEIITNFRVNRAAMLSGIFIQAVSSPLSGAGQTYTEAMAIKIKGQNNDTVFDSSFQLDVEYGSPFFVSLGDNIAVEEDAPSSIQIRLKRPSYMYPFGSYSSFCKNPCGLAVKVIQYAYCHERQKLVVSPQLTVVTGFQFLL